MAGFCAVSCNNVTTVLVSAAVGRKPTTSDNAIKAYRAMTTSLNRIQSLSTTKATGDSRDLNRGAGQITRCKKKKPDLYFKYIFRVDGLYRSTETKMIRAGKYHFDFSKSSSG